MPEQVSPGGYIFTQKEQRDSLSAEQGEMYDYAQSLVSGHVRSEPRPTSITFFVDNTAKVSDQYGQPIKGVLLNGKPVLFARVPPSQDDRPGLRAPLATHKQVIEALASENVDWQKLTWAGLPQIPVSDLEKIRDPKVRKDTLKARRDAEEREKELVEE